jgi:biotin carboxyl carrier protein
VKYFVTTEGETLEIGVEPDGSTPGRYRVSVGDRTRTIDARETRPGELSLLIDGEVETFLFEAKKTDVVAHDGLRSYAMKVADEREHLANAVLGVKANGGSGAVEAVMPGIVVKVLVEEGQPVSEGDAVLILEAMKMENEVRAEFAGRVERIHVQAGDAVEAGRELMTLASQ